MFSPNCRPSSCNPTGRPSERPHGIESPGSPARHDGIVRRSHAYIASGSAALSPIGNATDGDVGLALTQRGSLADSLDRCAEALVRHLDAAVARIWTLHAAEHVLELQASAGLHADLDGPHRRVPMGALKIGDSIHVNDLKLPKGVEPVLHRGENPAVATVIQPVLVTEEEEAAAAEAVPAAGEVPTTEQAAPADAAAAGDKAAADKGAKPAADKGAEKKEKK